MRKGSFFDHLIDVKWKKRPARDDELEMIMHVNFQHPHVFMSSFHAVRPMQKMLQNVHIVLKKKKFATSASMHFEGETVRQAER